MPWILEEEHFLIQQVTPQQYCHWWSSFLWCDTVSLGEHFLIFCKNTGLPSFSFKTFRKRSTNNKASHPRWFQSPAKPLWEPQISQIKPSTVTIKTPDTRDLLAREIWRREWKIVHACLSKSHKRMFFHFKEYNLEFICYFIVHNIISTESHSHTHQLIIPLKCPNLLLETFTEWNVIYILSFCKLERTLIYLFKDPKTYLYQFCACPSLFHKVLIVFQCFKITLPSFIRD